jgi:sugar O-acyltransferase (sialic acid O-acetyltransferase NeuD family)
MAKAIKSAMTKPIVLLAGGGHASVIADILLRQHYHIEAVVDVCDTLNRRVFQGLSLINDEQFYARYAPDSITIANGFGFVPGMTIRKETSEKLLEMGYSFETIISHDAVVSEYATIGSGVQILPGAIIQAGVTIGNNSIINTRAVIEHDTHIGRDSHIAPGAVICGGVTCGEEVFIGANATLVQNTRIGDRAVVGAAALVRVNVSSGTTFY